MGNFVNASTCLKAGGTIIAAAGFGMVLMSASFGGHTWMIITGAAIGALGVSALGIGCMKAEKAAKRNLFQTAVDDWSGVGVDYQEKPRKSYQPVSDTSYRLSDT